jgi:lupus La protein
MTDVKLLESVRKQIEFYFSEAAYRRDTFLQTAASNDKEGFVPIATLLTFNKLKSLTTDASVVAEAVKDSDSVILSSDNAKVKRSEPLPDLDTSSLRTLYVKGFPTNDSDVTIESIREQFFSSFGPINYVKMRRNADKSFKGSCLIEYEQEEDMKKVVAEANKDGLMTLTYKDVPFLCVMPYVQWFTNKQAKTSGNKRKATTSAESKEDETTDVKKEAGEGDEEEEDSEVKLDYVKGCLLEVKNLPSVEGINVSELKQFFNEYSEVRYVEKVEGKENSIILRLANPEALTKLTEELAKGTLKYPEDNEKALESVPVSEEDEKAFYDRLKANKKSNSGGGGRGGRGGGRGGRGRGRGGGRGGNKRQRR